MAKLRLGELLIHRELLTQQQLNEAVKLQQKTNAKLGEILVDNHFIEKAVLAEVIADQLNVPYIDIRRHHFTTKLVQKLPEAVARRCRAIVLEENNNTLFVGMADPSNIFAIDELNSTLDQDLSFALVDDNDLKDIQNAIYRNEGEIRNFAKAIAENLHDSPSRNALMDSHFQADAPVEKLLSSLFRDAIEMQSSDIHIEPDQDILRIRQRIDGVLQEHVVQDKGVASALTQRIKLLAGLDIAEKRLPQDGRFQLPISDRNIDVRISTMPIQDGESVVMRILDAKGANVSLDNNGMPDAMLKRFRKLIQYPHGMILVTGPTGSGKTTTLYSALHELNQVEKKIITVEDPVEYQLPMVNQVQVNDKIDLSFAKVLRAILRQDPDIVMVGEIRDHDTASIAMRAAVTGHLVLATIHTNNTAETIVRLLDMGIEPYLLASALKGIVAQRLVRKICDNCRKPYQPNNDEKQLLAMFANRMRMPTTFYQGEGCTTCRNTGYHGRTGIFEYLYIQDQLANCLRSGDLERFHHEATQLRTSRNLSYSALDAAANGITSLEEVIRIVGELECDSEQPQDVKTTSIGERRADL